MSQACYSREGIIRWSLRALLGRDGIVDLDAAPRILVVDDNAANLRLVESSLEGLNCIVETASDGVEAVERVRESPPDLLILDVMMPRMNGLEVCRLLKSDANDNFMPIILVTIRGDIESKVTGLKLGADDYLAKPYSPLELQARVGSMLRIKALQDRVKAKRRELEALNMVDDLTGLFNRRAMDNRLRDEFVRAQRYNEPLSVLLIDVDHFRPVNDRHGHIFGDRVLMELASLIQETVREVDVCARSGGGEFTVILPRTHFTGSLSVAERVWRSVGQHGFDHDGDDVPITISVGISFYPNKNVHRVEQLIGFAGEALHQAKLSGRNRICLYQHVNYVYRPRNQANLER